MKNFRIKYVCFLIPFISFWAHSILTVEAAEPAMVVEQYILALKNGKIEAVKYLLSDKFYKKRKVLLENNPNYSEFLRKFYEDSEFRIMKTVQKNEQVYVDIEQTRKDGSSNMITLILHEDKPGDWKINSETLGP